MFEINDDTENGIVGVVCVGELQPKDYEVSGPIFQTILEVRKPLRLLLDWPRAAYGGDRGSSLRRPGRPARVTTPGAKAKGTTGRHMPP